MKQKPQLKPSNNSDYGQRSSRSGSLVNTPDHKPSHIPVNQLNVALDDVDNSYQIRTPESSNCSSGSGFDTPPSTSPPVPPRIHNPPSYRRQLNTLVIIDTDEQLPPPIPQKPNHSKIIDPFENNHNVNSQKTRNSNTTTTLKSRASPPLLIPPSMINKSVVALNVSFVKIIFIFILSLMLYMFGFYMIFWSELEFYHFYFDCNN